MRAALGQFAAEPWAVHAVEVAERHPAAARDLCSLMRRVVAAFIDAAHALTVLDHDEEVRHAVAVRSPWGKAAAAARVRARPSASAPAPGAAAPCGMPPASGPSPAAVPSSAPARPSSLRKRTAPRSAPPGAAKRRRPRDPGAATVVAATPEPSRLARTEQASVPETPAAAAAAAAPNASAAYARPLSFDTPPAAPLPPPLRAEPAAGGTDASAAPLHSNDSCESVPEPPQTTPPANARAAGHSRCRAELLALGSRFAAGGPGRGRGGGGDGDGGGDGSATAADIRSFFGVGAGGEARPRAARGRPRRKR